MQIETPAPDRLVLAHDSTRWARIAWVLTALLAAYAGWRWIDAGRAIEQVGASFAGAAVLLLIGVVVFERSRFVIDASARTITWSRHRAWRKRSGVVSFADVTAIFAERPIGDEGVTRRLVFRTGRGDIPATSVYLSDLDDSLVALALRLRLMLGLLTAPVVPVPEEVRQLALAGQELQAIKALRESQRISLTDAHTVVRDIVQSQR